MDLVFGYLAGLLTLINPCVLPVLPIIMASALRDDRRGPLLICIGMSASFVLLGVGLARLGPSLGVNSDTVARVAALVMVGFGLVMLLPAWNARFALATAGLAQRADARIDRLDGTGSAGLIAGGALLGAVWSPCIGPTLGGAIALAARGDSLAQATAIMIAFALGVSTVLLALGYGAQAAIARRRGTMMALAQRSRPILGAAFLLIGLSIWLGLPERIEGWALSVLPYWFSDLSIMF
jgi:cytochrome c-type biogenesis protein